MAIALDTVLAPDTVPAMSTNGNAIGTGKRAAAGNGVLPEKQALHEDLNPVPARAVATAPNPALVQPIPIKAGGAKNGDLEKGKRSPSPPPKIEAGRQPDAVYAAALAPWRDSFRRWCVRRLGPESEQIARLQAKVRTPARDTFFFYSAIFGSEYRQISLPLPPPRCTASQIAARARSRPALRHGPPGAAWQVTPQKTDSSAHVLHRVPPRPLLAGVPRRGTNVSCRSLLGH